MVINIGALEFVNSPQYPPCPHYEFGIPLRLCDTINARTNVSLDKYLQMEIAHENRQIANDDHYVDQS